MFCTLLAKRVHIAHTYIRFI